MHFQVLILWEIKMLKGQAKYDDNVVEVVEV